MISNEQDQRIAENREKVHRLLTEASSEKLMRYETERALEKFKKAEDLIDKYNLEEPWPSLCAYRMGHLLLRTASTEAELKEARFNFAAARGAACLGPLPDIYYLAVMYRLQKRDRQTIKPLFSLAEQAIERLEIIEDPQLDDPTFNLIELASYFSGLNYRDLEGMGLPQNHASVTSTWMLVGPDPRWSNVVLSEAEALNELDELTKRKEYADAVFFKLSDKNGESRAGLRRHWKYKDKTWQKGTYQRLRLLALSLQQPTCSKENLIITIVGDDATSGALSRLKYLLKNDLSCLTGLSQNSIYDDSLPGFLRVTSELKIFGAVQRSTILPKNDK